MNKPLTLSTFLPTEKVRVIMYREFCEWCQTVPHLGLDPRGYTPIIEDGGYIVDETTAKAFAAWQAAHRAVPQAAARDMVPLPNERGWICKYSKYGTWFMSWAAVVKDLKQFREQFDDYNEPTEEDVYVWWREQTGWSEIESLGLQIEPPDMEHIEAAFRRQMKEDPDHVSYCGSVVEHHAAIAKVEGDAA